MATVHMIHGFLGAGKSTFAQRLAKELEAVRYCPDERMVELYGADPPADRFAGFLDAIYDTINNQWPNDLREGTDVVLDFGFWSRAQRDEVRERAQAEGATTKLYHLRCSEETARKRCRNRNQDLRGSLFIADETFDALKLRFEPLDPDEEHEVIDTNTSDHS